MIPRCAACGKTGRYIANIGRKDTWMVVCADHAVAYKHTWALLCATGRKATDMTGKRFGTWEVISRHPPRRGDFGAYWLCRCVCGFERPFLGQALRQGNYVKKCKHIAKEKSSVDRG